MTLFLVLVEASACTNRSGTFGSNLTMLSLPATNIVARAQVQYRGQPTNVAQMAVQGNTLYLTGTPFGFSAWDLGANAESPTELFATSEEIDNLQAAWRPDWYADNALLIAGQVGLMSGSVGASLISFAQMQNPVEIARFPGVDPDSDTITRDFGYVYSALALHPSGSIVYGLAQSDYIYTAAFNGSSLSLITKTPYSAAGAGSCIVGGAAVFQGSLFVACRSALWVYGLGSDGSLYGPQVTNTLQATGVFATPNHLYIAHTPNYGQAAGLGNPTGIYAFDSGLNESAFFPFSTNPIAFAVSTADDHLYTNQDQNEVLIYQISVGP